MADFTVTIPGASNVWDFSSIKRWDMSVRLPAGLQPGSAARYLRRLRWVGASTAGMHLYVDATGTSAASESGSDLVSAWENADMGITLAQGAHSLTIPGPANSSNAASDAGDNYEWTAPRTQTAAIAAFFGAITATNDLTITFHVPGVDTSPTLADEPDKTGQVGIPFSATLGEATDGEAPLTYSVSGLPAGLAFNASTRVISGTPTSGGTSTVTYRVRDNDGDTDDVTFDIVIASADIAPAFATTSGDAQAWVVDEAISPIAVPAATGHPAPAYTAQGLPTGLRFDPSARIISGIPEAAGTGTITITATNRAGSAQWTLEYRATVVLTAPTFVNPTADPQAWTLGVPITPLTVPAATGRPAPVYTATGLPAGLEFDASTRQIMGTPTALDAGTITVTATNSEGSAQWTLDYAVAEPPPYAPVFTSSTANVAPVWTNGESLAPFTVPEARAYPPATYTAAGLPAGVVFDPSARIISGKPTATAKGSITITADNTEGVSTWELAYTITPRLSDLLIGQWRESPRLRAIVDDVLQPFQDRAVAAAARIELMRGLDAAEGVWVDNLGKIVGIRRPSDARPDIDRRFMFDAMGQAFDSVPFADATGSQVFPISDAIYKTFIRARAVALFTNGGIQDFTRAVLYIDPEARVVDNRDMTVTITTHFQRLVELADEIGALPRAAGVRMIFVEP